MRGQGRGTGGRSFPPRGGRPAARSFPSVGDTGNCGSLCPAPAGAGPTRPPAPCPLRREGGASPILPTSRAPRSGPTLVSASSPRVCCTDLLVSGRASPRQVQSGRGWRLHRWTPQAPASPSLCPSIPSSRSLRFSFSSKRVRGGLGEFREAGAVHPQAGVAIRRGRSGTFASCTLANGGGGAGSRGLAQGSRPQDPTGSQPLPHAQTGRPPGASLGMVPAGGAQRGHGPQPPGERSCSTSPLLR